MKNTKKSITDSICGYVPGSLHIISIFGSSGKSIYSGQSKYQMRKEYPNIIFIPFMEAMEQIEKLQVKGYCSGPFKELTKDEWFFYLEVLPPADWRTISGVEVFHMSEMWIGDISDIYFRFGNKYFSKRDRVWRKETLVKKLLEEIHTEGNQK